MSLLIVGTNVAYGVAGGNANEAFTPNLLDAGSIGIYANDPTDGKFKLVVTGAGGADTVSATGLKARDVTFFQGLGEGHVYASESHQIKGIQEFKKIPYAAPTKQSFFIGSDGTTGNLNVPILINQGYTEAWIRIRETTPGTNDYGNNYYLGSNVRILQTDTDDTVADKLVASINADPRNIVVASKVTESTNRGIRIDVEDVGTNYGVSLGGVIENAPIKLNSYGFWGSGTPKLVREIEKLSNAYRGDLYTAEAAAYSIFRGASSVVTGAQYIMYWIRSINVGADKTGQKATVDHDPQTWLAVPTGAGQVATIDTILAALIVSSGGTGPQGPEGPQGPPGEPG